MSGRQVIEYVIEEPPPEEPPRRPWWLAMGRVAAAIAAVIVVVVIGYRATVSLADRVGQVDQGAELVSGLEITVEIPAGSTARRIAEILVDDGVIADGGAFETEVRRQGAAARLQAGSYDVVTGAALEDLIAQLVAGPPALETFRLTVVEGLRIGEMLESLSEQTGFSVGDFEAALAAGDVGSVFLPAGLPADIPEVAYWEGLLAPDTYEFTVEATPDVILQRLADTLADRVSRQDWSALVDLGLTPYDGLIIASLIEKEAKLDNERPIMSSVVYNRLDAGQRLQIDATIIYALGKNPGQLLLSDLEIESPYNTYLNDGLPPTPIGGVRVLSLEAAAQPEETEYLFYVLVDSDGTHGFSVTLEEHNAKKEEARAAGVIP
jgi:UPF0755 protein